MSATDVIAWPYKARCEACRADGGICGDAAVAIDPDRGPVCEPHYATFLLHLAGGALPPAIACLQEAVREGE
jgi:hypothetical protein